MVTTIPAIDRFLVPGELEKEADLAYSRGETAFLAGDFEKATHGFEEALSYVASFRGAEARQVTAQRQWDLSVADAAFTEAEARLAAGDPVRAYWAFDQAVNKVPDYKDATSRREQALTDATYSVGLSILLSEQIKETLAPATPEGGKWSRLTSSIDRAGRLDLASRRDIYSAYQARIYGMVAEELRIGGLPLCAVRRASGDGSSRVRVGCDCVARTSGSGGGGVSKP